MSEVGSSNEGHTFSGGCGQGCGGGHFGHETGFSFDAHLITPTHSSTPQGLHGGQLFFGVGHSLHIPALTFTFGQTHAGHFWTGGIVDFKT